MKMHNLPAVLHVPSMFYMLFYGTSKENLRENQDTLSLIIISFILVTCMFNQVVIL